MRLPKFHPQRFACNVQKLIKQKKIEFYNAKLTESIGKPKELWKALKNLGLPSKKSSSTNI